MWLRPNAAVQSRHVPPPGFCEVRAVFRAIAGRVAPSTVKCEPEREHMPPATAGTGWGLIGLLVIILRAVLILRFR